MCVSTKTCEARISVCIISYFAPQINTNQLVTKVTEEVTPSCYNKAVIKIQGGYKMSIFNIFARKDINEGVRNFRESKNAILLDVRTREEYASGHIEGSRNQSGMRRR